MAGWFPRLYGFDRSLWLDEFGTLWAIERDFTSAIERVFGFHGQSPLYYIFLQKWMGLFGESEVALRLPSLLFGAATATLLYCAGNEWVGWKTGAVAAVLAWLSPPVVEAAASVRPYALALLGESMAIYGFVRATRRGDLAGRALFVTGCAVLFGSHYVLVLPMVGLAMAYLIVRELGQAYTTNAVSVDASMLVLLCIPCLPHLVALSGRGEALSWLGPPDYYMIFEAAGALLVLAAAGFVAAENRQPVVVERSIAIALWLAVAAQAGGLSLLALTGSNLLDTRYLVAMVPPASLLAADGILRIRGRVALVPVAYAFYLTVLFFAMHFLISGSFSRAGRQDWRGAVKLIEERTANSGPPLVLFRSGFVESEGLLSGIEEPVLSAPLRSPGKTTPDWQVIQLNYRWDSPGRSGYLETKVAPAIDAADNFFVLLCGHCYNETTGDYPSGIRSWLKERFPGEYLEKQLPGLRGILLFEYERIDESGGSGTSHGIAPEHSPSHPTGNTARR